MKSQNSVIAYTLITIALAIFAFVIIFFKPFVQGIQGARWFSTASEYEQALNKMWASGGALEDFAEVRKKQKLLLKRKLPSEKIIINILESPNREIQKTGLAGMSLKPVETEKVMDILIEFLQDDDIECRYYATKSLNAFKEFPEPRRESLGNLFLEIIKKEEEGQSIPIEGYSLLAKCPSKNTAQFLTEKLMLDGEDRNTLISRLFAFSALKEMGESYYSQAVEYVNEHGSKDIKKKLLEQEKAWQEQPMLYTGPSVDDLLNAIQHYHTYDED